ncbi:MAG: YeeE/YedE family protein [Acidiferrobacterales bacterium]
MELENVHAVALWGFLVAVVFGGVANKTSFCTMGAVSDWVNMGDKRRLRAWFLAIGIAIIGTQILQAAGYIDLRKSIYLTANFGWLGHLLGGLLFGIGMTLGSGCGQRTLVRIGGGNLKSLVVMLLLGITAYMTLRGLLALLRVNVIEVTNVDLTSYELQHQGMANVIAAVSGFADIRLISLVTAAIIGLALVVFAFASTDFRRSFDNILSGLVVGLCVIAGWYITGVLGFDEFEPLRLESFTFVAPVGNNLQYLMTFTGATIGFGVAAVFGVIAGSFLYAVLSGNFRIEAFTNRSDMIRHMIGGVLMGFGGVIALGCTIGQAVTGMSALAIGPVITLVTIILGSALTMKVEYYLLENRGFLGALHSALVDLKLLPATGKKAAAS